MSKRKCEVCDEVIAKYTCPRCQKRTCSLSCVKKHKGETKCDGIRDKTAYLPMKEFTDIALLNDYRFLEEAGRIADNSKRDPKKRRITHAGYLNQIKRTALKRDIKLKFLPYPMMRRKSNTTTLSNYHYGDILWHVELIFPEAEAKYTESRVNENTTLQDILRGYIHPTESDPVKRQKLKSYCVARSEDYKVFLRKERSPANDVRYYELDIEKSLAANLSEKELIEYPTLYVVLPKNYHLYPTSDRVSTSCSSSSSSSKDESNDDIISNSENMKHTVTNVLVND